MFSSPSLRSVGHVEYTFHFAHRSGAQYLVSVERLAAADSGTPDWYYRWREATGGGQWVQWGQLNIAQDASLDDAIARARELVGRLYQTGDHRAPHVSPDR
jgi:hypothetical protein